MFEIALNKSTVFLSARGLEEQISTTEALREARRASALLQVLNTVIQHPLVETWTHFKQSPLDERNRCYISSVREIQFYKIYTVVHIQVSAVCD